MLPWALLFFAATPAAVLDEAGSRACASCHAEIYRKYSATGMARSSGKTGSGAYTESFEHGRFGDPASGAGYRVRADYLLEFARAASGVQGERKLEYFIGSGAAGRSYLHSVDGFLFQAPVSYYSQTAKWDVSPGYQRQRSIHLSRPIETACLLCHASRLQPVAGTQNRFGTPPFLEGGVSCERCHGPGKQHVLKGGAGSIVNPAKLDAARRDSVCAQCHLTGEARIARATSGVYRPGELLSGYSLSFVWEGRPSPDMKVTSHFEKLWQSRCKQASGDRLWCGSCHDPHAQPAPAQRVAYYGSRCAQCHDAAVCRRGEDCAGCHMPKNRVVDVEHTVYTDHAIPRAARSPDAALSGERRLVSFWKTPVEDRDLGMAYAVVAARESGFQDRALELLRKADDVPALSQLAQIYDRLGDEEKAMALCERILRAEPTQAAAAINLGTYRMQRGRAREAMRLWEDALTRNPALSAASVNLAVAQIRAGAAAAARATLVKALEYEPDHEMARRLLKDLN